jgi:hypothetical protein
MIRVSGKQFKVRDALPAIEVVGREASPGAIPAGAVIRLISDVDVHNQTVEAAWWEHRFILIADDLINCTVEIPGMSTEAIRPDEIPRNRLRRAGANLRLIPRRRYSPGPRRA